MVCAPPGQSDNIFGFMTSGGIYTTQVRDRLHVIPQKNDLSYEGVSTATHGTISAKGHAKFYKIEPPTHSDLKNNNLADSKDGLIHGNHLAATIPPYESKDLGAPYTIEFRNKSPEYIEILLIKNGIEVPEFQIQPGDRKDASALA